MFVVLNFILTWDKWIQNRRMNILQIYLYLFQVYRKKYISISMYVQMTHTYMYKNMYTGIS